MNLISMVQPSVAPQGVPGPQAAAGPTFMASGQVAQSAGGSISGNLDGSPAAWLLGFVLLAGVLLHYGR